jgi:acylglycerol lipase
VGLSRQQHHRTHAGERRGFVRIDLECAWYAEPDAMPEPDFITLRHADGYEASARYWPPAAASARGAVLYIHGIQSHGGWYEHSGGRLADAGFAVLMPDRRGSGRNTVHRGHTRSAAQLLADGADALDELRRRTGLDTAHLIGVSWGGKLALNLVRTQPRRIRSLTLVAPGFFPVVDLPVRQKPRVALAALFDRRQSFDIPITDPEMFTATPRWLDYLRNDSLSLRQVTAAFLLASRRLDRFVRAAASHPGLPTHLILAERDRIIDNARTAAWLRELGWPDATITQYDDAYHTLEFEPDPDPFITDMIHWLTQHAR